MHKTVDDFDSQLDAFEANTDVDGNDCVSALMNCGRLDGTLLRVVAATAVTSHVAKQPAR